MSKDTDDIVQAWAAQVGIPADILMGRLPTTHTIGVDFGSPAGDESVIVLAGLRGGKTTIMQAAVMKAQADGFNAVFASRLQPALRTGFFDRILRIGRDDERRRVGLIARAKGWARRGVVSDTIPNCYRRQP